jgi:hypothetical protein
MIHEEADPEVDPDSSGENTEFVQNDWIQESKWI